MMGAQPHSYRHLRDTRWYTDIEAKCPTMKHMVDSMLNTIVRHCLDRDETARKMLLQGTFVHIRTIRNVHLG